MARQLPPILERCTQFTLAEEARDSGLYPFFKPISQSAGAYVYIDGRKLSMFGSNNYLGLANDPRMAEAAQQAASRYGTSCSGSRFMNGTLDLHEELEQQLADFVQKEAALCFTTGYQTNLGAISALVQRGDHLIVDKYDHASIMDGVFLAQGMKKNINLHRFRHNDMEDLEKVLSKLPFDDAKMIIVDGVFSMEGDITVLPQLREVADRYNAAIYLDEAHALGVIGETGRGTGEHWGGRYDLADLVMCTFSKSFGSIGGFIAGDHAVIDYIKHFARPLIFSASMPPANIAAAMTALKIIREDTSLVASLQRNAKLLREGFLSHGFDVGTTETAIVPLIIGDNEKTFLLWRHAYEQGIYVNPVISPAVPPSRSLLRTSCMAVHTPVQIEHAVEVLAGEAKRLGIIH